MCDWRGSYALLCVASHQADLHRAAAAASRGRPDHQQDDRSVSFRASAPSLQLVGNATEWLANYPPVNAHAPVRPHASRGAALRVGVRVSMSPFPLSAHQPFACSFEHITLANALQFATLTTRVLRVLAVSFFCAPLHPDRPPGHLPSRHSRSETPRQLLLPTRSQATISMRDACFIPHRIPIPCIVASIFRLASSSSSSSASSSGRDTVAQLQTCATHTHTHTPDGLLCDGVALTTLCVLLFYQAVHRAAAAFSFSRIGQDHRSEDRNVGSYHQNDCCTLIYVFGSSVLICCIRLVTGYQRYLMIPNTTMMMPPDSKICVELGLYITPLFHPCTVMTDTMVLLRMPSAITKPMSSCCLIKIRTPAAKRFGTFGVSYYMTNET